MTTGFSPPSRPARRQPKAVGWLIGIVVALFILIPIIVGVYTDWLWFGELNYRGVFTTAWVTRIVLFLLYAVVAGLIVFAASYFTWRGRPDEDAVAAADLNSPVQAYRQSIEKSVKGLLVALPIIVGLIAGFMGQGLWRNALMWVNSTDFGVADQQFGRDYAFYAFALPMLNAVVSALLMLVFIAFIIALVGHYMLGGIRIANQAAGIPGHITKAARTQLGVWAGIWMLLQALSIWLSRYNLLYNEQDDLFTGAGFTDVNAHLPARLILTVIAVVVAAAFFFSMVYKDLRIPGLAVVLMLVSGLVVGAVYPWAVEQFSVSPNRQAKESEYIARNIESTRYAYGLTDDKVTYVEGWGAETVSDDDVAEDSNTISNIRLLDPDILSPTFTQMQQLRNFYGFPETLSMDRYEVDGELRDHVVAVREINPNSLQDNQRDWINRHTFYTHGNGFIAAQANTVDEAPQEAGSTRGGFPVYTVSDLQTNAVARANDEAEELGIHVEQPRVYYGPVIANAADGADYAIVGNDDPDVDFEYDTDNTTYTYDGEGGVNVGNWFNRVMYALKYQEINFILSDRVNSESKILYDRDPAQRVSRVAPWLTTDSTAYPAVIDGSIKWIVDGYTTLSALPYSQRTSLSQTTVDTLNPDGTTQPLVIDEVGYIRNSVKAVVDAYDGSVELYEFDTEDPVLQAWMKAFPGSVNPESEISDELREHLRYPQDLFRVQREIMARYHVDDPGTFFNNDAFWSVPADPTAPDAEGGTNLAQPPYYVVAADPQNPEESSFQIITPYRGLNREFLAAHMTATSDPDNYGQITVRILPTNTQTQGPRQAQDAMMSSDQVARDRTLWEGTNTLHNGNLLTLPVGGGEVLYAEPIYSQRAGQDSAFPKLLRVLVSYKGRVGYAPTVSQALEQVGIDPAAAQEVAGEPADLENVDEAALPEIPDTESTDTAEVPAEEDTTEEDTPAPAAPPADQAEAAQRVSDAMDALDDAREGSWEEFGAALDELDDAVADYQALTN